VTEQPELINDASGPMNKARASAVNEFVVSVDPVDDEATLVEEITQLEATQVWSTFTQDQRDAMVGLVRDALARMGRGIETWLPEALIPRSNDCFAITILWKFQTIDEAVILMRAKVEAEAQARINELRDLADGGHG
jgi:hypothetical protein